MPVEPISRVMTRIKNAAPSRPIAVFVVKIKGIRQLDALYANTTEAMRRRMAVKPFHPTDKCPTCGHITQHLAEEYIGDFHNNMNMKDVRNFLEVALNLATKEY